MKNKGVNLNTLTMSLTNIVPFVPFMLFHIYVIIFMVMPCLNVVSMPLMT